MVRWGAPIVVRRIVAPTGKLTPAGARRRSALYPGFTLVELLVVTAIIMLLAGMLMAGFAYARRSAREASCISNLHQVYMAISMYREDHDGCCPRMLAELQPHYATREILL